MATYIQPFTPGDIKSGAPLRINISVPFIVGCSYVNSSAYWFVVRDKSGYIVAFIGPGTQGNANFTTECDDNVSIERFLALPPNTDIAVTDYFTIRFNPSIVTDYTVEIGGGGEAISANISGALPVGHNHIGSVSVDGGVNINNWPAKEPVQISGALPAGNNKIGSVDISNWPTTQQVTSKPASGIPTQQLHVSTTATMFTGQSGQTLYVQADLLNTDYVLIGDTTSTTFFQLVPGQVFFIPIHRFAYAAEVPSQKLTVMTVSP